MGRSVHRDRRAHRGPLGRRRRHGTPVEDELDADQVEIWADVRDELRRWRGGIGIIAATGTLHVRDLVQRP
ncbi:MAG: hypothetical protein M0Z42_11780 [Actinomycetota bacterium]|jgi:hypothetical protein|nr:hypothetical protein [Actinomycetota bacterium]